MRPVSRWSPVIIHTAAPAARRKRTCRAEAAAEKIGRKNRPENRRENRPENRPEKPAGKPGEKTGRKTPLHNLPNDEKAR